MKKHTKLTTIPDERNGQRALVRLQKAVERGEINEIDKVFEEIYNTYVHLVSFVCGKYLSNEEDIKEVTNQVFIHFFNHLDSLDPHGEGLKYYLTVSAKNLSLNQMRDQRRHKEALLGTTAEAENLLSLPDPDGWDMGTSLRYRELVDALAECMDQNTLDIVLRHAVIGESFTSIGAALSMKPSTVKTAYYRALATFRRKKGAHWT